MSNLRIIALVLAVGIPSSVAAHEPVFSLGPETIWEGGVGIETEFEFEDERGDQLSGLHYEVIYGLTSNLSLTFELPQILDLEEDGETEHGLGDIEIRAKYQFFKKDLPGAQHKITGIFGVKAPTGDDDAEPALGTGTTEFLFGASYGYESRSWYHFLTARYRLRTESGDRDPGDRDLALVDKALLDHHVGAVEGGIDVADVRYRGERDVGADVGVDKVATVGSSADNIHDHG